ncbi:MAG: family 20 glycosylhydrolase [Bacteroidales bacterium]|nr:family 20 glycosylhydrolase [Bacteroidales bacterium]
MNFKSSIFIALTLAFVYINNVCAQKIAVVPQPSNVLIKENARDFVFSAEKTKIFAPKDCKTAQILAESLQYFYPEREGVMPKDDNMRQNMDNSIIFVTTAMRNLGTEGYVIDVNDRRITIEANDETGFFYALQTLWQLIGTDFYLDRYNGNFTAVKGYQRSIAPCRIEDYPRFAYRGKHLDCARHFFDASYIKKYIDLLAFHKINVFHWHLTDDQGWRLEIKKYPKLQEVAAYRNGTLIGHYSDRPESEHIYDTIRYGGYYTQQEVKEIVKYAAERHITIIPEIELPGHSMAAIAAYPELSCRGEQIEVCKTWGVLDDVFCPKEKTFKFIFDVLDEVMDLFPSEYIHIGGDECPTVRWQECKNCQKLMKEKGFTSENQIQGYFTTRVEDYLNAHGRKIIGWDEILEKGVRPSATILSWQGEQGGINAAKQGNDAIMAASAYLYFNFYQGVASTEPLSFGGFTPLKKTYLFEPVAKELSSDEALHIIGMQACTWTEYIDNTDLLEYNDLPRMSALSERAWSKKEINDYEGFVKRLDNVLKIYEDAGFNYSKSHYAVLAQSSSTEGKIQISLSSALQDGKIYYTINGGVPTENSTEYTRPFTINSDAVIQAAAYKNHKLYSPLFKAEYHINKATGKPYEMSDVNPQYNAGGGFALTDGIRGNKKSYDSWVGTYGKDFCPVLDMGKSTDISSVSINFLDEEGSWIFLPKEVKFYVSEDKVNWKELAGVIKQDVEGNPKVVNYSVYCQQKARYVKVLGITIGNCPEGHSGAGYPSHMFGDEIEVR